MPHTHDIIEPLRAKLLGFLGVTGNVTPSQYAFHVPNTEDFEYDLHQEGFKRNLVAYHKREWTDKNDWSVGSWAYRESTFSVWQHHVTVFRDGATYNHKEYNWRRYPIRHIRETGFRPAPGWLRERMTDSEYVISPGEL